MAATGAPATLAQGRYVLAEELGAGGMASVWRAEDTLLRREVAVKLLYPHLLRRPELRARFLREARAAAALDHPTILRIFDVGADEPPFIVMEFLRGISLKAFLDANGPPLAELVALIGATLAAGIAVAHAAGVVHRDLKPANVMVEAGGRLVICDFGLAYVDDDALATQSGELLGTPTFMPPEQALGRRADQRSDVYSLGATLYQLATGTLPYRGSSAAVVQQVIRGQLEPPLRRNPAVGPELSAVIARAMAAEPGERYASAVELGAALDAVAAAAGFADRAAELAAYFADPGSWNRRETPRLLAVALAQARSDASDGKVARALGRIDRMLALDPAHSEAHSLLARLGVGNRRRRQAERLLGVAALLAIGSVATVLALRASSELPLVAPARPALPAPDAAALDAAARDAQPFRPDAMLRPVPAAVPDAPPGRRHADARPRLAPAASTEPVVPPLPIVADAALPAMATVEVRITPWCEITLDGVARGRSPSAAPLVLAPGPHTLVCAQPGVGVQVAIELDLAPGERRLVKQSLYAAVAVRIGITHGDVRIDGVSVRADAIVDLAPGPHAVEVRGESPVGPVFVHIPTHPCVLHVTSERELVCVERK